MTQSRIVTCLLYYSYRKTYYLTDFLSNVIYLDEADCCNKRQALLYKQ